MAFKAIIDLDVNDANFQDFMKKFEKFAKLEKDIPKPIEKMDKKIKQSGRAFEVLGSGIGTNMRIGYRATKDLGRMLDIASKGALTLSSRIRTGTKDLEKMGHTGSRTIALVGNIMKSMGSALPFIGGALVGASFGALALYRHQSRTILDRYKSAKAMGVTPGQQAAVETSYAPILVNPQQTFAQMRGQMMSPAGASYLSRAIGSGYHGMGPLAAMGALVRHAKRVADHTATRQFEVADVNQGFKYLGITAADMRLLKHTSWASVNAAIANAKKNRSSLGFSRATGRHMSDIAVTIAQKEMMLSTALSRTLAQGAPAVNAAIKKLAWVIQAGANHLIGVFGGKVHRGQSGAEWWRRIHNPMDIEAMPGDASYTAANGTAYARFGSNAQNYRKAGRIVRGYGFHYLSQIANAYTGSYVSKQTLAAERKASGLKPGEYLNLQNPDTLARVVTALRVGEHPHQRSDAQLYQVIKRAIIDGMKASGGHGTPAHSWGAQMHMAAHG